MFVHLVLPGSASNSQGCLWEEIRPRLRKKHETTHDWMIGSGDTYLSSLFVLLLHALSSGA